MDINGPIGLGTSKFGSINGISIRKSIYLIEYALDHGINFFDTASSYGQGDSEIALGNATRGTNEVVIATKIGKQIPTKAKLCKPIKPFIRILSNKSSVVRHEISNARGGSLDTNFQTKNLSKQLDYSRKNLKMDCVPLLMLHNPSCFVLSNTNAIKFLKTQKELGNARKIGISSYDSETFIAGLNNPDIDAIQFPFEISLRPTFSSLINASAYSKKFLISREVYKGVQNIPFNERDIFISEKLTSSILNPNIDITLIGTTKINHLKELLEMSNRIRFR